MCYNKLISKARKKWLQLSAIIFNTSNGDVRRLLLAWNQMPKMFVIHYYINMQILNSYLHTKSKKIWLLFTFVLNWVFLWFPWQQQAFWNFQASKPFIHMTYNISIKFHPIASTLKFSRFFVATAAILKFLNLKIMCTHVRQNFWKISSNSEHHSKPTMIINSQHHNLLGNQISPKSEDFCTLAAILDSKWSP